MVLFIGGGIILLYLGIVIASALCALVWAGRRNFSVWGKSAAVLIVLTIAYAIPFGDHTIGLIKFKKLCDEQAGERIFQAMNDVGGLMWSIASGKQAEPYTTHGYAFSERKGLKGELYRYVRQSDGSIKEELGQISLAKYEVRMNTPLLIEKNFTKSEFLITDLETGSTLASYTSVHFSGGWLIRDLGGIGLSGPSCPNDRIAFDAINFTRAVLKPRLSKENER